MDEWHDKTFGIQIALGNKTISNWALMFGFFIKYDIQTIEAEQQTHFFL